VAGSNTTFAEYAAHWIETHQLKSQTRTGYRSTLNAHLRAALDDGPDVLLAG
jgi:hypothetical protein